MRMRASTLMHWLSLEAYSTHQQTGKQATHEQPVAPSRGAALSRAVSYASLLPTREGPPSTPGSPLPYTRRFGTAWMFSRDSGARAPRIWILQIASLQADCKSLRL